MRQGTATEETARIATQFARPAQARLEEYLLRYAEDFDISPDSSLFEAGPPCEITVLLGDGKPLAVVAGLFTVSSRSMAKGEAVVRLLDTIDNEFADGLTFVRAEHEAINNMEGLYRVHRGGIVDYTWVTYERLVNGTYVCEE